MGSFGAFAARASLAGWRPSPTSRRAAAHGGLVTGRRGSQSNVFGAIFNTVLQSNPQFRFNSIFCSSGRGAPLSACTALANHVTHVPCESQGTTRARFRSHTPIATCISLPSTATLRKGHRGGERCARVVLRCLSSSQVVVQVWGASTRCQRAQNAKTRSLRGSASTDEGANALGDTNEGRCTAPSTRGVAASLHEVAGHARHRHVARLMQAGPVSPVDSNEN